MKTHKTASLPNRYDALLQSVIDKVEYIRNTKDKVKGGLASQYNNIVGIVGNRGFGKSTLLLNAYRHFKERPDITIEPITPDEFRANDSFFSIVLVKLEDEIRKLKEDCGKAQKIINKINDLLEKLKVLQLDQARSSGAFLNNLRCSGLRGDDFSWQVSEAQSRKLSTRKQFPEIIEKAIEIKNDILIKQLQKAVSPLFIISIDDCDTAPELIPRFIEELEEISRSPEVVVLVAYSSESMDRAISYKYLNPLKDVLSSILEAKISNYDSIQKEVRDLANKYFPTSHRIYLPGWSNLYDRLNFKGILNRNYSLIDNFYKLKFEADSPLCSIAELFDLSNFITSESKPKPSYYSNMLPMSGRGLSNLQESINIILQSSENSTIIKRNKIGYLIRTLCDVIASEFSVSDYAIYSERVLWDNLNRFDINFSDLFVNDSGIYSIKLGEFKNKEKFSFTLPETDSINPNNLINELDKLEQEKHSIQIELMKDVSINILKKDKDTNKNNKLSVELCNLFFFLMEWKNNYFNCYHVTRGGNFNLNRLIFANTISTDLDDDFEQDLSFFLLPAYDLPVAYNILFEVYNSWSNSINSQKNELTDDEKNRLISTNDTTYTDLFGFMHLNLVLSLHIEKKLEPIILDNVLKDKNRYNEIIAKLKIDIVSHMKLIKKGEVSKRRLFKSFEVKESLLNILIHLANTIIFSNDFASWIRNEILLPNKEYLLKDINFEKKVQGYYDYCIKYAKKSFSRHLIQDFSESICVLDKIAFNKVFPIKFKLYVNRVRLFQPYTESFLLQLVEKKLLDAKDITVLGEKGLVPQIRSKLSLLEPETSKWIISELEELLSTEP